MKIGPTYIIGGRNHGKRYMQQKFIEDALSRGMTVYDGVTGKMLKPPVRWWVDSDDPTCYTTLNRK